MRGTLTVSAATIPSVAHSMIRARKLDVGLFIGSVSISKIGLASGGRQAHCHVQILTCSSGIRLAQLGIVHDQEKPALRAC
jgi:hypothetical protein